MHNNDNHRVSVRNYRKPFTKTCLMLAKRFRGPEPKTKPEWWFGGVQNKDGNGQQTDQSYNQK